MPLDNAFDNGQPDACPIKIIIAVQPAEEFEQFAAVSHIETNTVVGHEVLSMGESNMNLW